MNIITLLSDQEIRAIKRKEFIKIIQQIKINIRKANFYIEDNIFSENPYASIEYNNSIDLNNIHELIKLITKENIINKKYSIKDKNKIKHIIVFSQNNFNTGYWYVKNNNNNTFKLYITNQ